MQEYQKDTDRTYIFYTKQVCVKELAAQGAPVGKLVVNHLMRQIPANEEACKETANGKHYLSCKEVEQVEQRAAANLECVPLAER